MTRKFVAISGILVFLTVMLLFTRIAAAMLNTDNKEHILASYVEEENGIKIGEGRFNLARFYRDVLKLGGDPEALEKCASSPDFATCASYEFNRSSELQYQYNERINSIRTAVAFGEEHGMDYMSVPYIHDLLSE